MAVFSALDRLICVVSILPSRKRAGASTNRVKEPLYLPDPPLEGIPLNHPYYDDLWAEIADLGVPLGIHEAAEHLFHPPGLSQLSRVASAMQRKRCLWFGCHGGRLVICGGGFANDTQAEDHFQ